VKRILAKRALIEFWDRNPDARVYLETWYETVKNVEWSNPFEVKNFYAKASILKNSRVVFNIKGNEYRLVVKIEYKKQWIFIRIIGTHEEYNRIDTNKI
jgi:mRNA interferase HigB